MNTDMKKRLLTAAICVPFLIIILFSPKYIVTPVVMLCCLIGMYEFFGATGLKSKKPLCILGYLAAAFIPFANLVPPSIILIIFYLYVCALFVVMLSNHKEIIVTDLALLAFGLIYIPVLLSHIIFIRGLEYGNIYIWLIFVGAFMADTFAYFTGVFLGKHKLCPKISPKKTIEGAIGGILGCGLSMIVFAIIINRLGVGIELHYGKIFVLGLVCAVASIIGDLVASVIKRQMEIKDFGNLLPGHGGILDRLDSIILVAPAVFLFIMNVGILL